MANQALEDLTAAGAIADADLLLLVQGGNSRKVTIEDIKTALAGLVSATTYIAPYKGVLLKLTADIENFASFPLTPAWQAAEYDTNGFWNIGAPTRITIPAGVTKVRLQFGASITNNADAHSIFTGVSKNGTRNFVGNFPQNNRQGSTGFSNNEYYACTAVIPVVAGDYFEGYMNASGQDSAMNDLLAFNSYFSLEVVEGDAEVL